MSEAERVRAASGISPSALGKLVALFEHTPKVERVWLYGSRARGDFRNESDIDLMVDAPEMSAGQFSALRDAVAELGLLYPVDLGRWQAVRDERFRARIESERALFWAPRRRVADMEAIGGTHLKPFQSSVLAKLGRYLDELCRQQAQSEKRLAALAAMEDAEEYLADARDFPRKAWEALKKEEALPSAFADHPYTSRFDGAGRPVPNLCFKVPTGGGKTLLAAASVARVFSGYLNRHTGLVLWVVPNDAIYRQTLKALSDRDHPYRQILNVAGAGRVKILEKGSPLSRIDVESHLCVMVLMLQSAARQSKETLRFFRDRGNVLGFLPREDDIEGHWDLLQAVPNLDVYAPWGASDAEAAAQMGSIVKSSLGNVMRLVRPMVVIDEGHHGYTENALATINGFNPSFMLELSATPRVTSKKGKGSNILVDVRGTDLDIAEMIKLPIHVDVRAWSDWQSCVAASVEKLDLLAREAERLQAETARYIRPILLVQVERTGADLRDAGFIHAEDAREYLLQLGFKEREIAVKTSEKNDLKQPENLNLLSPTCEVRVIITKQALQEGWDCPFAYILCALAAGRNPAAMTQLVGRILRQPQVAKTGREALDACYVLCHDARTADVVRNIKKSLETEGMGDLAVTVSGGREEEDAAGYTLKQVRRPHFAKLRIFVPKVTWVESGAEPGAPRRELVYESDVLARVRWEELNPEALAKEWAPERRGALVEHLALGLDGERRREIEVVDDARLDRSRLVRGLLDIAPNAWLAWAWVDAVVMRLKYRGYDERTLAGSSASLLERLRIDLEAERDRLAQRVFEEGVADGRIEFRLRADRTDYELPHEAIFQLASAPQPLTRDDARVVEKSLLEPAVRLPDMNDFEAAFAGYLDERAALRWWHRNVAKAQYGLQGWKRHKVYPDFVFAYVTGEEERVVLLETKGTHLEGSSDTRYKEALLARLTAAFRDERVARAGELILEGGGKEAIVCDLIFDQAWQGTLEARYFSDSGE